MLRRGSVPSPPPRSNTDSIIRWESSRALRRPRRLLRHPAQWPRINASNASKLVLDESDATSRAGSLTDQRTESASPAGRRAHGFLFARNYRLRPTTSWIRWLAPTIPALRCRADRRSSSNSKQSADPHGASTLTVLSRASHREERAAFADPPPYILHELERERVPSIRLQQSRIEHGSRDPPAFIDL
jgi:hypothetical protein